MFILVLRGGGGVEWAPAYYFANFLEKKVKMKMAGGGEGTMGAPRFTTVFSTEFQPVIRTQYNNRSKIDAP